ncbi:MAG TPA: hypothetical protein VI318_18410 [Baekduia sp.]
MPLRTPLLAVTAAALASVAIPASASAATVSVHAIFGGTGVHVGQVLDVRAKGHTSAKVQQICWAPAPIGRAACSTSNDGAPSAVGTTKLTLKLADGSTLRKSIAVARGYAKRGGHGGSDAAAGHVACSGLTLWGNVPRKGGNGMPTDQVTTLATGAQVAQYNSIGNYVFYWEYATNKAGFGKVGCVQGGLGG